MRLRLADFLELIVVLAAGLAVARWATDFPAPARYWSWPRFLDALTRGFVIGASLAGGVGLWREAARRPVPTPWGIGRRTWAIAALTALLLMMVRVGSTVALTWKLKGMGPGFDAIVGDARYVMTSAFPESAPWTFAAIGLASLFDGQPRDPSPDAREWSGRALLALIVGQALASRVITLSLA